MLSHFSHVRIFVAHQTPLSMGFSRQEYLSGLPCPTSWGSSQPREWTCTSCIAGRFFTTEPLGKPFNQPDESSNEVSDSAHPWWTIRLYSSTRSWEALVKQVLDCGHSVSKPGCGYVCLCFFFKLYNTVLVLPNIKMNPPQVYLCSPSWTLLPPPSPYPSSGLSQCTSPKHPVSCIEPGLATHFIHDIIHVSTPFSQIFPPSPSPTESIRLIYTSVSLLLCRTQGYCYHLSKFHIYVLVYCIGVFLSGLLHSV